MNEKKRIILHVDMDHFYTAVEERLRPELKGKPVIVGADPKEGKGRGVVSTSNYEAREFGVRSAMPISRAWKLCPQGTYLPINMKLYERASNEIMNILREYAGKFEQCGIDEAFLDITSKVKDYAEAEALALKLKKEIFQREQLTCSIGIGPNKTVAKIASDIQKPNGLTIVIEDETKKFLAPLPVRKLPWVGRKTEQALENMGIRTIGDLANCDATVLSEKFGAAGAQLYSMAHGMDKSEVEEKGEVKSIGRDITFQEDTADTVFILKALDELAEDVYNEILRQRFSFKTVTIRVRYENFETHMHGKTLPFITGRLRDLTKTAQELIRPYLKPDRKIRLVGIRASNFVSDIRQKKLV
jgi:DNA polymerase IV (DinB-like DNA polymerase)